MDSTIDEVKDTTITITEASILGMHNIILDGDSFIVIQAIQILSAKQAEKFDPL